MLHRSWESWTKAKRRFATVEKITDSEPVNGEELVESEDLKRQFREAKERLESELP